MMLVQLQDLGTDDFFDVCIIGTGPAGISCALALIPSGKRILMLEGGDTDLTYESQSLYQGSVVGDEYYDLDVARLRYFGGTSNHWNGRCRPLEEIDFAGKGDFADTAWPITRSDLEPFLPEASSIVDIGQVRADRQVGRSGLRNVYFLGSPPTRFRKKYLDDLSSRSNLFLVLRANLVALETDGAAVAAAKVVGLDGSEIAVRARRFVLATGGIENSRLLLWSNVRSNGALVRNATTLGRYWMEHPHFYLGRAIILGDSALRMSKRGGTFVAPMIDTMERERILGSSLKLSAAKQEGTMKAIADIACVAPNWARRALDLVGLGEACALKIRIGAEQEPVAENRVELADEKDALGIPKVVLHWRKTETDIRTIRMPARLFGEYLARTDSGRVQLEDWVIDDRPPNEVPPGEGGYHHMGGTRMASTPFRGVVDRDCKVFGQENLYVAGSSIFPSGGYCNPTLSIVQLALRLGNHLRTLS